MRTQQGFNLIELVIVIAIIGILAVVAIPAYQLYVARAQTSEAISMASSLKSTVTDIYSNQQNLLLANSGQQGLPPANALSGTYVAGITVIDGTIVATMKTTGVAGGIAGRSLALEPQVSGGNLVDWTCKPATLAGFQALDNDYLPASCRS